MIAGLSSMLVAASTAPKPVDNDIDSESAKSGPIGLAIIVILCVACYFLFKSMSKHLRSVREGSVPVSGPTAPVARPRPQFDIAVPLDPGVREEPAPRTPPPI